LLLWNDFSFIAFKRLGYILGTGSAGTSRGEDEIMGTRGSVSNRPSNADVVLAAEASRFLIQHLPADRQAVKLNVVDELDSTSIVEVPTAAMRSFVEILNHMARGESVTIFPIHAELSTQEAADLLNVSRPHLIKLLEADEILHHRTGSHRRIRVEDLVDYMNGLGKRRKDALDELTAKAQQLGLDY